MKKVFKFYTYEHPKTGEQFRELREFNDKDRPYISSDKVECHRKPKPGENNKPAPGIGGKHDDPPLRPVHIKL